MMLLHGDPCYAIISNAVKTSKIYTNMTKWTYIFFQLFVPEQTNAYARTQL